jgi:hypothetical protein
MAETTDVDGRTPADPGLEDPAAGQPRDGQPLVIYLDSDDDIVSIQDRLAWVKQSPVVLVLPGEGNVLADPLDLILLRRRADALRLEVGLVTADGRVTAHARPLGFPTFATVEGASRNQRRWWRGRRRQTRLGWQRRLDITVDEADRREVKRRRAVRPARQQWLIRYGAILLFFVTLAILVVAAAYVIPGATITLQPEIRPIEVTSQIVADPQLESIDYSGASVPARLLTAVQAWQAQVETTGTIEVPDAPARGRIVFANLLDQPVTVPAGTRVSTSTGNRVVYQTLNPLEVPGVVGATAETDVVAVEPGPEGNVEANQINRVEGSLALQLQVRNLEPMTGGGVRQARAVTEADQERLRAQVLQQLQVLALGEMDGLLIGREFLARDSLRVARVLHETYSHFPGDQTDRLALEIRAELQATAVDETQANGLLYEALVAAIEPGYELVPDSLEFSTGDVLAVDSQGRITFEVLGQAVSAARLSLDDLLEQVAGQERGIAMTYLYEHLPLRTYPTARVWPGWLERLPYLPVRIQTEIETIVE